MIVLEGEAVVSGRDGIEHHAGPGTAVLWTVGESHETRTVTGFSGLAIEGDFTLLLDE